MPTTFPMAESGGRESAPPPFERIAIVGYGLIGGSLGLAIKAQWPSALVIAVDRREVIEAAMRMSAADVGGDDLVLAAEAELIVLAAPVRTNMRLLADLPAHVPGPACVTDVGSTKREMVERSRELPPRFTFVGGHPLAGAATSGLEAARDDLFAGRPWLLTPGPAPETEALDRFETLLGGIGARPRRMSPDDHDALVAYISHLPQLVASALMHVVGGQAGEQGLELAGRGLRDTTRLATSPPSVWQDIVATNADHIGAAIDAVVDVLVGMKAQTGGGDLARTFDSAARWKRALERNFEES